MKKIFLILIALPFFGFSQTKKKTDISAEKGFVITGNVTGFTDGTAVSLVNKQTNQIEQQANIKSGKFIIKGQLSEPDFKVLVFGNTPPFVPLFIDNSSITIKGDKNSMDQLSVTGSPSHTLFTEYTNALKYYDSLIATGQAIDSNGRKKIEKISTDLVEKHPSSYVSPLVIIYMLQLTENGIQAEKLYKLLPAQVQSSWLAQYANQQIQELKINPIGSTIKEFSQNDTAGNPINISSFRGQYVLLDFWASWCRPCRMENPNVVAAYNKFHNKNFTILSVSLDQAKPAWLDAIQMDGLTWNHVSDLKGWKNEVASLFHITSIPQNLLIDPDGKIIAKNLRGDLLVNKLAEFLK